MKNSRATKCFAFLARKKKENGAPEKHSFLGKRRGNEVYTKKSHLLKQMGF
jgi:hypothetical protein